MIHVYVPSVLELKCSKLIRNILIDFSFLIIVEIQRERKRKMMDAKQSKI